jgi:hypothetical protein
VQRGGSIVATYETSLYDEEGKSRSDFGLSDLFGVTSSHSVEGPLQNSYLRIMPDADTTTYHSVVKGLEDAYRIINGTHRVKVAPTKNSPSPVTLVPTYPDLPMEDVYPRTNDTDIRELYLHQIGAGRVAYFPGDLDRAFWQIMSTDHSILLRNTIRWALQEEPIVEVSSPGVMDVTTWRQEKSMTVHLVNLTNPMMMKGPIRELIPVDAEVKIRVPASLKVTAVKLLMRKENPKYTLTDGVISLAVPDVLDHEIVALDLG